MPNSTFAIDMPRPYYWEQLDNFFHKLTAMESPRKNNDCYFYYYSTCTKGDNCTFRHEPSALGCETMCSYWQQGKCLNQHCNFRHMELRKNRKAIPCYWETQPSGCRKPHCPFQHKNPREPVNVEPPPVPAEAMENNQHAGELSNNEIECARPTSRRISQTNTEPPTYGTPSVDPLVVNFEEESDNESTSNTPVKFNNARFSNIGVKTLEEIRLEKIQEASAALYFYGNQNCLEQEDLLNNDEQDLRQRLRSTRLSQKKDSDFEILTLTEIRKRKSSDTRNLPKVNVLEKVQNVLLQAKNELEKNNATNITTPEIKIKTLDEIRAERALKNKTQDDDKPQNRVKRSLSTDLMDSSNCKRLKIQRKKSISCESITDCNSNNSFVQIPVSEKSVDQRLVDNESTVCDTDNLSGSKMITVPNLMCDIQDEEPHKQIDSYNDDVTMDEDTHISDEKQRHDNTDSNDILQDIDQLLNEND
ncbi:zinc finger CCCH domain-containing protein 11A-like isoform X2 [Chrysoperla carnea]|uniref:zinc finger CCCH domain-containing protein 11A-like isoform X2 n=1 Tax=Chrysoperla carnea TaxID=189513 RepID=UPI001D061B8D|nr:zinc finger CCCH domain-containing protein 11A-like isoform X2 [Chrysoperla carnea]